MALHFVEPPLSLVHASVLVVEDALSMSHTLQLVPFVFAPLLVALDHVFSLGSRWSRGVGGEEGDAVGIDKGRLSRRDGWRWSVCVVERLLLISV